MLLNPYMNRSMIRSVDAFYGRKRELQRVMALIGAQMPQSVSLVGERRMGKSSLLWHISQPDIYSLCLQEPNQYVFATMDFSRYQQLDQAHFCRVFSQHLREAVDGRLELPEAENLLELEELFQALERAGLRLICLFDEFETITRNPSFGAEFFAFLRSVANTYPVGFITASRRRLETLCHDREIEESPFFNIFTLVTVGPMSEAEVQQLIAVPSAAAGAPLEPHAERILDLGGHLPFYVQIACAAVFDCLAEGDGQELDWTFVEQRFVEEASSHFHYLWENFEDGERRVIVALLGGEEPGPEQGIDLRSLESQGYVERADGGYRLFSSAFDRFLQEELQVAEEGARTASAESAEEGDSAVPPKGGSRLRLLGGALGIVVLVFLGVYSLLPDRNGAEREPVAEAARQGLRMEFSFRKMEGYRVEEEGTLNVAEARDLVLRSGDGYRLSCTVDEGRFLYVYWVDAAGGISQLPDPARPLPAELRAGVAYHLPQEPDSWIPVAGQPGRNFIYCLASRARNRDLEETYLRFRQARADRKREYGRRLVELCEGFEGAGEGGAGEVEYRLLEFALE